MGRYIIAALAVLTILLILALLFWPGPKDDFVPQRVDTCSDKQNVLPAKMADCEYPLHQWSGQNNHNWTSDHPPWDPDSKIQPIAAALTPSTRRKHLPINPISRIGVTSRVRNWDNPYGGDHPFITPCSKAVSVFDVQPFQPGFMQLKHNDSTDGTPFEKRYYYQPEYWSRASGPYGGPYKPLASCEGVAENQLNCSSCQKDKFGGPDWQSRSPTGRYTSDLAQLVGAAAPPYHKPERPQSSFAVPKETLRSRGNTPALARPVACGGDGCLSGIGCGLGNIWTDVRYQPGPQAMYHGGDYAWAQGTNAGGPTATGYTPYIFKVGGNWNRYVRGAGDKK